MKDEGTFDKEDEESVQFEDWDDELMDEEVIWIPLELRLSQSEFLAQIVAQFEDWDDEARSVRDAKVRFVKEGNEHAFVVELVVAFEAGMTAAERGKHNQAETEVPMQLRTKPL